MHRIASRRLREPTGTAVPLSKLRAVGEVAELETDALRFDAAETAQLFTETYGRRIDADVLEDLAARTEGWIASLQLVQAALRDRSPAEIRRFVRTLKGADHELYDYLAEEVVGDLEDDLQRFLMETSILEVVMPAWLRSSDSDAVDVARLTAVAERLTLLGRLSGGPRTHQRYHPLVRGFLEARLRSTDGPDAVAGLHRRTAAAAAGTDWKVAAHHYREAGDTEAMLGVVAGAIPTIMGNGQYALAEAFIGPISDDGHPLLRADPEPRRHAARRLRGGDRRQPGGPRLRRLRPSPARPRAAESRHPRNQLRRRRTSQQNSAYSWPK